MAKYLISVGGTGMRCTEAFVQLCAMGMFDGEEFIILSIDTDKANGNLSRLDKCIKAYQSVRGKNTDAQSDTFFSAKITNYKFTPDYTNDTLTFEKIYNLNDSKPSNKENVVNLLFSNNVQTFHLTEGYRAQTQLGSMLMYKAIVETVKNDKNKSSDIYKFTDKLMRDTNSRVFIMGSIFGGTGASSIPVIPKALADSARIIDKGSDLLNNSFFGATLITKYFSFANPTPDDLKDNKIIATSTAFDMNSQAALLYYFEDPTIKKTYQKFYLMGCDDTYEASTPKKTDGSSVCKGGKFQENDAHYIELLAAGAAFDFFDVKSHPNTDLKTIRDGKSPEYLYRSIGENGEIDFKDIISSENIDFGIKFGRFLYFGFLLNVFDVGNDAVRKITKFEKIQAEVKLLMQYFEGFYFGETYDVNESNKIYGWLSQLYKSSVSKDNWFFNKSMMEKDSIKSLSKVAINEDLYSINSNVVPSKWVRTNYVGRKKNHYNVFWDEFADNSDKHKLNEEGVKLFIKLMYNTINALYPKSNK